MSCAAGRSAGARITHKRNQAGRCPRARQAWEGNPVSPPGRPKGEYRSAQHEGSPARLGTAWEAGRLDAGRGPPRVLFGRMYEDPAIERAAFAPGGRVFCIASAGCTAMHLAPYHEVVAVDINPAQLAYATQRIAGAPMVRGTAEHVMRLGRVLLALAGWKLSTLRAFLDLDDPATQHQFWKAHLDTRRFRCRSGCADVGHGAARRLRAAPARFAPRPLRCGDARADGAVLSHPPESGESLGACAARRRSVERATPARGESDRARPFRRRHLSRASAARELRAASRFRTFSTARKTRTVTGSSAPFPVPPRPRRMVVLRSFGEPVGEMRSNRAADDRSILWGIVDVRPAATLLAA